MRARLVVEVMRLCEVVVGSKQSHRG
eukprot:SAG22_NODE_5105_length_1085_cov_1.030426_1_plen_25_part_10